MTRDPWARWLTERRDAGDDRQRARFLAHLAGVVRRGDAIRRAAVAYLLARKRPAR
jgi:hypothetical protein